MSNVPGRKDLRQILAGIRRKPDFHVADQILCGCVASLRIRPGCSRGPRVEPSCRLSFAHDLNAWGYSRTRIESLPNCRSGVFWVSTAVFARSRIRVGGNVAGRRCGEISFRKGDDLCRYGRRPNRRKLRSSRSTLAERGIEGNVNNGFTG